MFLSLDLATIDVYVLYDIASVKLLSFLLIFKSFYHL